MSDGTDATLITERDVQDLVARLAGWAPTLSHQEQRALAFLLERATAEADNTRGHIIIVSGAPARFDQTAGFAGGSIWRQHVIDLRQSLAPAMSPRLRGA
jgi:hypothetical protein